MKGSIQFIKKTGRYRVAWYNNKLRKNEYVYKYNGEYLYHEQMAYKLLSCMQADEERGIFDIRKYKMEFVDTVEFIYTWFEEVAATLAPGTRNNYKYAIKNHLAPFFQKYKFHLHEIKYDVLLKLLNSINTGGKAKWNVMYCLHACLDHAWRAEKIESIPPFPKKKHYQIQEPKIEWLPEERQIAVINAIPEEHQPIFWFLKYHLRRPGEAMALHRLDYDPDFRAFTIRRSVSSKKIIERTKTSQIHIIPCHPDFLETAEACYYRPTQFLFTNPNAVSEGQRYTHNFMGKLWNKAAKECGETIKMYPGLKHSSCCQYINEKGLSVAELQEITDHAKLDSVKRYAKTELTRKAELMKGKVFKFNKKKSTK